MTKKLTRTRAEAKKLMWEHYRDNKAFLPRWIGQYREEILDLLVIENNVSIVFDMVIESAGYSTL
jgi:hypothetical protein